MIRKLLFVASFFAVGFVSAQSFQLLDHNDIDITGTTHYEIDSARNLGETKFHIKNLTNSQQAFSLKVERIYTPYTNSGLACCFGVACYSASGTVDGVQVINDGDGDNIEANAIYNDLKVAPVVWPWENCPLDSAVWRVTVYSSFNASDSASANIIWRCDQATSVQLIDQDAVKLKAFPNPVASHLTINYSIDGVFNTAFVDFYDMLGQKLVSTQLSSSKGQVLLDVGSFNAGIYFYAIKVDGQTIKTERVVVK
jgi:hypothetical protein